MYTHTHLHHSSDHFPAKLELADCPHDSQPAVILSLSIFMEQAKLFLFFFLK